MTYSETVIADLKIRIQKIRQLLADCAYDEKRDGPRKEPPVPPAAHPVDPPKKPPKP